MTPMRKADLHVHSKYSSRPSQWILKKLGCPESFTEPAYVYRRARAAGMDFVTVTDHNVIDGALEIAHLPGAFVSEEVTAHFPEDKCKVHVLVYGITEGQHREIQRIRENVYELSAYLRHLRNADAMLRMLHGALRLATCPASLCFYGDHVPIMPSAYKVLAEPTGIVPYFCWSNQRIHEPSQIEDAKRPAEDTGYAERPLAVHDLALTWLGGQVISG